jgi:exopolyphosphatase/pppGpp-phosphohydrolase
MSTMKRKEDTKLPTCIHLIILWKALLDNLLSVINGLFIHQNTVCHGIQKHGFQHDQKKWVARVLYNKKKNKKKKKKKKKKVQNLYLIYKSDQLEVHITLLYILIKPCYFDSL